MEELYKVKFNIDEEGLLPSNSDSFDPVNTSEMIFHDVFEHFFEGTGQFIEDKKDCVGGEIAAMGKLAYFTQTMGVYNRLNTTYSDNCTIIKNSITLETHYQGSLDILKIHEKPSYSWDLEDICNEITHRLKEESRDEDDCYRKVKVHKRDVSNLLRWGFRNAEKDIPDNKENLITLCDFIELWKKILNSEYATIKSEFKELEFIIYKEEDIISWKATLTPNYYDYYEDIVITNNNSIEEITKLFEVEDELFEIEIFW